MTEKVKNWLRHKLGRKVEPKLERSTIIGYYNGNCPRCGTHIGIDIFQDKLTGQKLAYCASCGKEIFGELVGWTTGSQ